MSDKTPLKIIKRENVSDLELALEGEVRGGDGLYSLNITLYSDTMSFRELIRNPEQITVEFKRKNGHEDSINIKWSRLQDGLLKGSYIFLRDERLSSKVDDFLRKADSYFSIPGAVRGYVRLPEDYENMKFYCN